MSVSFVMYVCLCPSARNNSAPTGGIFMKYDICVFFENVSKNFKFYSILTRTTGTLHEGLSTFITISHPVRPRIRNISEKKEKFV